MLLNAVEKGNIGAAAGKSIGKITFTNNRKVFIPCNIVKMILS